MVRLKNISEAENEYADMVTQIEPGNCNDKNRKREVEAWPSQSLINTIC